MHSLTKVTSLRIKNIYAAYINDIDENLNVGRIPERLQYNHKLITSQRKLEAHSRSNRM